MPARRKISVRKIIQTLVTLVLVAGCTLAMLSADRQHRRHMVRDVQLKVQSPGGVQFLTEDAVRNMLFTARHINPYKLAVAQLDERSMEAILRTNPWVREAQVYTDAGQVMHISVMQRVPVVRLFGEDGDSYYLDSALQSMPLSTRYTHYTPVVTGVPHLRDDSAGSIVKGAIVSLERFIAQRPFWNAQISQVAMRADGGFELIPVLGKQHIILGDTSGLDDKFANLLAFYRQIQNKVGWDKYTTIDLRYDGQVVASPALPWKVPVDKALSNINWLKAIMDSEPARQDDPGGDAAAISDSTGAVIIPKPATDKPVAGASTKSTQPAAAHPPARGAIHPASPAPRQPKLPPDAVRKKPAAASVKKTTRHEQNIKPHAATNR